MKIYVASSWRNLKQQGIVAALRTAGHEVYDFKNPAPGEDGFAWSEIGEKWQDWQPESFRTALDHPVALHGFNLDMTALKECDICVLVLPCGRSAHLEAGWAAGAGKHVYVLMDEPQEPELMYAMLGRRDKVHTQESDPFHNAGDGVCTSLNELLAVLERIAPDIAMMNADPFAEFEIPTSPCDMCGAAPGQPCHPECPFPNGIPTAEEGAIPHVA